MQILSIDCPVLLPFSKIVEYNEIDSVYLANSHFMRLKTKSKDVHAVRNIPKNLFFWNDVKLGKRTP